MISSTNNDLRTVTVDKDTWVLELPEELCSREGFAPGTMASLTFKDGGIKATFISPSGDARRSAERFVRKYPEFMKEMERIGD